MFRLKPDSRAWTFFQSMLRVPPLPFWFVRFLSPVTLFDRHHYKTCFKNIKDSNIFTWSSPIGYFCIYVINQTMQLIFGLSVLRIPLYILMVIVIRRIELFHSSSWIYATLTIKKRRTSSSLSYIARKILTIQIFSHHTFPGCSRCGAEFTTGQFPEQTDAPFQLRVLAWSCVTMQIF